MGEPGSLAGRRCRPARTPGTKGTPEVLIINKQVPPGLILGVVYAPPGTHHPMGPSRGTWASDPVPYLVRFATWYGTPCVP